MNPSPSDQIIMQATGRTSSTPSRYAANGNGGDAAQRSSSTTIATTTSAGIVVGGFTMTPKGLIVDPTATEQDWKAVGDHLQAVNKSLQWLIADWIACGCERYKQTYESLSPTLKKHADTLKNWSYTASNVSLSRRSDVLSFKHHTLVARCDAEWQDYWLKAAQAFKWSTRELEDHMTLYEQGLPEDFVFQREKRITPDSGVIAKFNRSTKPYERELGKIVSKADKKERHKIAARLRQIAESIENAE